MRERARRELVDRQPWKRRKLLQREELSGAEAQSSLGLAAGRAQSLDDAPDRVEDRTDLVAERGAVGLL